VWLKHLIYKPTARLSLRIEMWIGHSNGWLSIVAHRERPDDLLVRARRGKHISTFWPEVEVVHNPDADYPYRSVISRDRVAEVVMQYIEGIDYDNFKKSVTESKLAEAFSRMWALLYEYGVEFR
tara:strand:+ start:372 stop:743 length:372 start_codon:yes stop_codon:yes gene_type:complete